MVWAIVPVGRNSTILPKPVLNSTGHNFWDYSRFWPPCLRCPLQKNINAILLSDQLWIWTFWMRRFHSGSVCIDLKNGFLTAWITYLCSGRMQFVKVRIICRGKCSTYCTIRIRVFSLFCHLSSIVWYNCLAFF